MIRTLRLVSASLIWTVSLTAAPGQEPRTVAPVPRLKLEVGQELRYHLEFPYKNPDGSLLFERTDWTFWVVDATADGGRHVVVRQSTSYAKQNERVPAVGESGNQVWLGSCNLYADGRSVPTSRLMDRIDIGQVFPRLPANDGEVQNGWEGFDNRNGKARSWIRSGVDVNEIIVETL